MKLVGDTVHFEIIWKMFRCSKISFAAQFKNKPQTSITSEIKMHKTNNKFNIINTHAIEGYK